MKSKVFIAALAILAVPMFSNAVSTTESVVGNTCLVPIFHTNFPMPPEGGQIIKTGNQMYFVQTYLSGCENAGNIGTVIKTSSGTVPGTTPISNSIINSVVGNTCLVPIFHTNFPMPPEGGVIIKEGNQMYFVQNYLAGCENAANGKTIIKSSYGSVAGTSTAAPKSNCLP